VIGRILLIALLCGWYEGKQAAAQPTRIAYPDVFPPFTELKDGKANGLAVDLVRAAAARVAIDVEFIPVPFEQVQRTLEDGRAEAIFPVTFTPTLLFQ